MNIVGYVAVIVGGALFVRDVMRGRQLDGDIRESNIRWGIPADRHTRRARLCAAHHRITEDCPTGLCD